MGDASKLFLIKLPYWLGIAADALWAVALFSPRVFGLLTGRPGFSPDLEVRLIMSIGGTLMTGWTWNNRNAPRNIVAAHQAEKPAIVCFFIASTDQSSLGLDRNLGKCGRPSQRGMDL